MKQAKLTDQFAVVGTPTHNALLGAVADHPAINDYKALAVRAALDLLFDTLDGELRGVEGIAANIASHAAQGKTETERAKRKAEALEALLATPQFQETVAKAVAHITGEKRLVAVEREVAAL